MISFRQFLESDELGQPDQEDMSGNWDLEIVSPEDIKNASNRVSYLLRNFILAHPNPDQAIKNLEARIMTVISNYNEGIIGNLFGKPAAPQTSLFPQEPEIQQVPKEELWGAIEELIKNLMSFHKGNRQQVEHHLAVILNGVRNRVGIMAKQKRVMKPKSSPPPTMF